MHDQASSFFGGDTVQHAGYAALRVQYLGLHGSIRLGVLTLMLAGFG
jgi:hypothetical protein